MSTSILDPVEVNPAPNMGCVFRCVSASDQRIHRFNGAHWNRMPGLASQVHVGSAQQVLVVTQVRSFCARSRSLIRFGFFLRGHIERNPHSGALFQFAAGALDRTTPCSAGRAPRVRA